MALRQVLTYCKRTREKSDRFGTATEAHTPHTNQVPVRWDATHDSENREETFYDFPTVTRTLVITARTHARSASCGRDRRDAPNRYGPALPTHDPSTTNTQKARSSLKGRLPCHKVTNGVFFHGPRNESRHFLARKKHESVAAGSKSMPNLELLI